MCICCEENYKLNFILCCYIQALLTASLVFKRQFVVCELVIIASETEPKNAISFLYTHRHAQTHT